MLVSNVPGGSHGSVMATELASSPADGYTLGVSATAAFTYSPHFVRTKYGLGDFQFLTLLGLNQSGKMCIRDRIGAWQGDHHRRCLGRCRVARVDASGGKGCRP